MNSEVIENIINAVTALQIGDKIACSEYIDNASEILARESKDTPDENETNNE